MVCLIELNNVTLNILKYYTQFQNIIEQHKENGKKPIHAELKVKFNYDTFYQKNIN